MEINSFFVVVVVASYKSGTDALLMLICNPIDFVDFWDSNSHNYDAWIKKYEYLF
jgi:hypothetical protein